MKRIFQLLICCLFSALNVYSQLPTPEKADDPLERINYELDMISDPTTGKVPVDELIKAHITLKDRLKSDVRLAISGINWTERGPNNIGGRTRALMFDPNDATKKRLWAGGVAGGLWYNNDITSSTQSWIKINDFWDNLAISSIAYDPTSPNTFYVGTGEGWFNSDAVQGGGIWKTTDGGTTWNVLTATIPIFTSPSTQQLAFQTVQKVIVTSSGAVFAATVNGVWKSTNGGTTWTSVLTPTTTVGSNLNFCSDLEYEGGVIYAGFGRGTGSTSVHKSADEGVTWTNITPPSVVGGRTELAVGSGVIYAVADNNYSFISYFKKSIDGGTNWTSLTIPTEASLTTDVTNGQAWYDLILAVSPTDDNTVYIGGASFARSIDGGTNWFCFPYSNAVHPDHHNFIFRPNSPNEMVMANDGGIYYSTNFGNKSIVASGSAFSFVARNKNYNVTQPYSVATKNIANDGYMLHGNQDNGTTYITSAYNTPGSGNAAGGGDGMLCFIDQNEPTIIIGSFQYKQHYTINPTTNTAAFYLAPTDHDGNGYTDGIFLNPCDYDYINNIFYSNVKNRGATGSTYPFSRTVVTSYNTMSNSLVNVSTTVSGMNISFIKASPYSAHTIYFGTTSGRLFKVTDMNTATPVATQLVQKSGAVSCIEIGASDNELILTYSNYNVSSIWYSNDGGATWIDKDVSSYGLPNIPVRYALFNPNNRKQVMIATELGVWSTRDITAANPGWQPTNANLANVRCDMLHYRSSDNTVSVATHGRGVYTTQLPICSTNITRTATENSSGTVLSGTFIKGNTANVIPAGVNKTYSAKSYILLEPKFEAVSGSLFQAVIGGCD